MSSRVPRSQRGTIAPTKKIKSKAVLKADNSSSRTQLMNGVLKELKSARTYIIGENLRLPHKNLLRALKKKGDDSHGLGGDAFRFFNKLNNTQKNDIDFWLSKNRTAAKIFLKFLQKTKKTITIETFWFAKDDLSSLSALRDQKRLSWVYESL